MGETSLFGRNISDYRVKGISKVSELILSDLKNLGCAFVEQDFSSYYHGPDSTHPN